jgi:hypothetical protein
MSETANSPFDSWEANHAALVGRRSTQSLETPASGSYWTGAVRAEIEQKPEGFRWFVVSGDGKFHLAKSPRFFSSFDECKSNLRSFSPSIIIDGKSGT